MANIRVELLDVVCRNSEDILDGDEFYIAGAVKSDAGHNQAVLTTPMNMDGGDTQGFPANEAVIFNADVPSDQSIAAVLLAYDEDVAKDWSNRPEWIDTISKTLATTAGSAAVKALTTSPVGWGIIAGALTTGLAVAGVYLILGSDKDDQLSSTNWLIPVAGPRTQEATWSFSRSDPTGWSSWDYTVRFRLTRGQQVPLTDYSLLREQNSADIYVIFGGAKFEVPNLQVLGAYGGWEKLVVVPDGSTASIPIVPRDGTILREMSSADVYLMRNGEKSLLGPGVLEHLGGWIMVRPVPDGALQNIPDGPTIRVTGSGQLDEAPADEGITR